MVCLYPCCCCMYGRIWLLNEDSNRDSVIPCVIFIVIPKVIFSMFIPVVILHMVLTSNRYVNSLQG